MPELRADQAKLVYQLTFEGAWPASVVFLGSGDRLAAGNRDGLLYAWDLTREPIPPTEEELKRDKELRPNIPPVRRLVGHTNGISQLAFAEQDKMLVSASFDGAIRLWDTTAAATGTEQVVLDSRQRQERAQRDKKNAEAILAEPGVDVETQESAAVLAGHEAWVTAVALSADGRRLISGDDASRVIVWDYPARKEIARWSGHPLTGVCSAAITGDGRRAFVAEYRAPRGSFDRPPAQAKIFGLDEGEMLVDLLVVQFPDVKERDNSYGYGTTWGKFVGRGFVAADFSPDGKLLAVGQGGEIGDGKVHLIDVESGKLVRTVSNHKYGVTDVAFSADGKHLLSAGRDTTLRVCRTDDGKEVAALGKPRGGQFKDWFHALALSPDERRLAVADIAGIVHVWDLDG